MSDHVNFENLEMNKNEADGLESFIYTSSIRVEFYRSFEYCQTWEIPMYPRRSSRLSKASKKSLQRSPSPNEEVILRRLRSNQQRKVLRKTKDDVSVVNTDEERDRDIIDIINSTHDTKHVAEEDEGKLVAVANEGVDLSDEDCYSVTSSVASGPSFPLSTPKKLRPLQGMCSACQKLYQRVKKMKTPTTNKLLDNDPKSLTCDQWILIKNWRPRRLPDERGRKLLTEVQQIKKRLNSAKQTEKCVGGEPSSCSRLHTFLQRNVRRQIVGVSVRKLRKKNRRKRKRDDFWSSGDAKKKRLHSSSHRQHTSTGYTHYNSFHPSNGHSNSPGFEGCTEREIYNETDRDPSVGLLPSTVSLNITKLGEVPPKQKAPKKTAGFRDLLSQLRGNSSMIIRETR